MKGNTGINGAHMSLSLQSIHCPSVSRTLGSCPTGTKNGITNRGDRVQEYLFKKYKSKKLKI